MHRPPCTGLSVPHQHLLGSIPSYLIMLTCANYDDSSHYSGRSACNEACYHEPTCKAFVLDDTKCWLKSCTLPRPNASGSDGYVITGSRPPPPPPPAYCYHEPLSQTSVVVMPTYTEFQLSDAGNTFQLAVKFVRFFLQKMGRRGRWKGVGKARRRCYGS